MKKGTIGLCAAVVICSASVAQAQGHRGGGGWGSGGWWAPAIVGGVIAGALAAPYYAAPYSAPYYAPTYAPAPAYGSWWWCDATQSYYPYVQTCQIVAVGPRQAITRARRVD